MYLHCFTLLVVWCLVTRSQEDSEQKTHSIYKDFQLLERLAFHYGSDKSFDDHKYVDAYDSMFGAIRHHIFNITELGVAAGQSLQIWHYFFSNAEIHGHDLRYHDKVRENLRILPRIHLHEGDCYDPSYVAQLNYLPDSMDIIIDDAEHTRETQEIALQRYWQFVKPGGWYIMEDVNFNANGGIDFEENPDKLQGFTREVYLNNHVFIIDSAVGHRNWDLWTNMMAPSNVVKRGSYRYHDSYLLVIRKRMGLSPKIKTFAGSEAMQVDKTTTLPPPE